VILDNGICGMSTDVSATGIRFMSDGVVLTQGEPVTFVLTLDHQDVVLRCTGSVVRVDRANGKTYIAAAIHNVDFDVQGTSH